MSIVCIGVNHRSAPLEILERISVATDEQPKALADLAGRQHLTEVVLLSTCNRLEIYASAERFHGGFHDVQMFMCDAGDLPVEHLGRHVYVHHDEDAVAHLFEVAAGLDSAVLGESEILGQVKQAWDTALAEGASGTMLNLLFRHAVEVGKRARTETGIARNITSVSQAAVAMAVERLGSLAERRVLVLGAGEIAEGMVVTLAAAGPDRLHVANRTAARADELAARVGATATSLAEVPQLLTEVDVLLTGTGASSVLLDHGDLDRAVRHRAGRPLLIVDVAVPRDVDASVASLDGVTLLDMDDLTAFAELGRRERAREVDRVRSIIGEEVVRFSDVRSARELTPLITSLRGLGEAACRLELERHRRLLGSLDDEQRAAVEVLTRGVVAKLLHEPTVRLKDAAGTLRGDRLADSLRELFDL